jgi:hypothetical protein
MLFAASLILAPHALLTKANSSPPKPPIEQPLVSEGAFAKELANALSLDSLHDEAAAENALASVNIAPRNGWISNYPITPDIVDEIRQSAARSASSGSLNMSESEATRTVDSVGVAMNLPVKAAGDQYGYESGSSSNSSSGAASSSEYQPDFSSEYQPGPEAPPPEVSEYMEPGAIDQYYGENGPPVVSYYPPPWDYAYLYDWVPYPFWWGGFGFGGFFVLGDFNRYDYNHHHWVSNHVTNSNGTVTRVNAVTRATTGTGSPAVTARSGSSPSASSHFNAPNAQAGARSILNRQAGSTALGGSTQSTTPRNLASSGSSYKNTENAAGTVRNPVSTTQNLSRGAYGSGVGTMSRAAAPSYSPPAGRSFNYAAPMRSYGGGFRNGYAGGYHGGSMSSSFRGGSGFSGGHGGGTGGGGGHR